MIDAPEQITLEEWDARYTHLRCCGLREPSYGGALSRHVSEGGDRRLAHLWFDNSPAALRLWNFILTEEDRLHAHRAAGRKIVGAMKDLGTVPVMAFSLPGVVAFYPDGAWWTPCVMEMSDGLLAVADSFGLDESFCPVRAMLAAFVKQDRFPIPDLLTCSAGATCDDFAAVAQRVEDLGYKIHWWEVPPRRSPESGEPVAILPGGAAAPAVQVEWVRYELNRLRVLLGELAGLELTDAMLAHGIRQANAVRRRLARLREAVFTARRAPLPALELHLAEMLAIHFCSDREETLAVLDDLLREVESRVAAGAGLLEDDAARIYWINPVADLRAMNLLEECGGRLCGSDFMFTHAIDPIPEDMPPLEALARTALADPMIGPARDRAKRAIAESRRLGAEAVLVSRVPGASHSAFEGELIRRAIDKTLGIPVVEVEIPPLCDGVSSSLRTRIEALVETVKARRSF